MGTPTFTLVVMLAVTLGFSLPLFLYGLFTLFEKGPKGINDLLKDSILIKLLCVLLGVILADLIIVLVNYVSNLFHF